MKENKADVSRRDANRVSQIEGFRILSKSDRHKNV